MGCLIYRSNSAIKKISPKTYGSHCVRARARVCTYVCVCVCMNVGIYVCMYVMWACMYDCVYSMYFYIV